MARYAIAVGSVICAVAVRLALAPLLFGHGPLLLFTLSVMVAARFGGVGPGLCATALSAAIGWYFFLHTPYGFFLKSASDLAYLGVFALVGTAISVLNGQLRGALKSSAETSERYRTLSEAVPQLVWTSTPEGSCDYVNARWLEYTGMQAAEPLGFGWLNQIYPEDRAEVLERWKAAVAVGGDFQIEFRIRRHDGVYRWFYARAVAMRDPDGRIQKWFGSNTDIHEARMATEALRAEQERLGRIAATAPGVICSFRLRNDGSVCFPYASAGIQEIYGLAAEDLMDDAGPVFDLMHAGDVGRVRESIAESARTMKPWQEQFRVQNANRGEIWVQGYSQPARLPDGSVEWYGFISDISAQKRVERELRNSEERLELSQGAAGIATWDWDIAVGVTHCSDSYGPLYGLPRGHLGPGLGEWLELIHPGDHNRVKDELQRAVDGVAGYDTEFRILAPNGCVKWLMGKGQVYRDSAGKAVRVLGVNMDITGRKTAAEQLRALSASLISAQEEERRRISRELHDDLTQRLGLMAMDLGKLASEPPDSKRSLLEKVRVLQERAVEAAELTRHIAHELHPSILDDLGIEMAVQSYCDEFSEREDIAVEFSSSNLPRVVRREAASCLYAVVKEALLNASKHARAGGVVIVLAGGENSVRLSVVDDGIGFASGARTASFGLGIVNMRERVRWVNGTFSLESEPGRGTRILVEVPVQTGPM